MNLERPWEGMPVPANHNLSAGADPREVERAQAAEVDVDLFQLTWDLGGVVDSCDEAAALYVDGGRYTKDELEVIIDKLVRTVNHARRLIRHDLEHRRVFEGHPAYRAALRGVPA